MKPPTALLLNLAWLNRPGRRVMAQVPSRFVRCRQHERRIRCPVRHKPCRPSPSRSTALTCGHMVFEPTLMPFTQVVAPSRELFVRVRHHKATRIELASRLLDVLFVRLMRDVHRPGISLCIAINQPFRESFANSATLKKTSHNATGEPVIWHRLHWPNQKVSIW
ncbi:hypothetical protein OCA8868_02383 [Octadecabacter ascidiaceicola]|uniref:Uncharacterized protein n=1 Tax=Octadecabacter ascidiaceicola TaxID=1655543 RepID=A0A238KC82_9RHOB|nr:hypothetical protein OCA8868_02383 [Octadecabacter ascidiaceicola]